MIEDMAERVRPHRHRTIGWGVLAAVVLAIVVLAAAVVLVWRPWSGPANPPEAAQLPTACPSLPGVPAPQDALLDRSERLADPNILLGDCQWGQQDNGFPPLSARYSLYRTASGTNGTDQARRATDAAVTIYRGPTQGLSLGADTPVAGAGDEARFSAHGSVAVFVARKANVMLTLQYLAPANQEADQTEAMLASYARTLLAGVAV